MENFNYNVIIKNNGNEIVIKTNDVNYAIHEFLRACDADCEVCLCNGYTGEVLCHNGDEPWCTDEMALMILGYMCAEAWGEEDEDEEEVFCSICGGDVADGICQWCGRCVDCEDDEPVDPAVALVSSLFGISTDKVVAIHNHTDDKPACGECGGPVNENGVCQHCGVEDDTLTAEDVVLTLIQSMGGLPS